MAKAALGPLDIIRASQWLPLEAPEKAVLIAMVLNERMTHATWRGNPSVPALAMASGYKRRRVQMALGTLSNSRLITRVDHAEGGADASEWRIEAFRVVEAARVLRGFDVCGVHGLEGCTTCTRAQDAPAPVDARVDASEQDLDHTHTPTGAGACDAPVHHMHPSEEGQGPRREAPHRPNFPERKPPRPEPPPAQLADRDAFVQRWNLYAEEFYPGQPSQRWESTTLAARRGHTPGGFFASPRDEAKEQAMLEFGDYLLPMLDRYAECCRGDHGEGARRAFERGDFEGRRMMPALHLWVTTGKAPHWVTVTPWKPDATPPNRRRAEAEGPAVDNAFLEPEGSP